MIYERYVVSEPSPVSSHAVSHVSDLINLAVGCRYFMPGPRLPFPPQAISYLFSTEFYRLVAEARV